MQKLKIEILELLTLKDSYLPRDLLVDEIINIIQNYKIICNTFIKSLKN